jgi:hypothetical protein
MVIRSSGRGGTARGTTQGTARGRSLRVSRLLEWREAVHYGCLVVGTMRGRSLRGFEVGAGGGFGVPFVADDAQAVGEDGDQEEDASQG